MSESDMPSEKNEKPERGFTPRERGRHGDGAMDAVEPVDALDRSARRRAIAFAALIVVLIALTLSWRWIPMLAGFEPDNLTGLSARVRDNEVLALSAAIAVFLAAGLLAVPVTLMYAASGLVFGPLTGFLVAVLGANLSAALTYWIGGVVGGDALLEFGGGRIRRVGQAFARRGMLTTALLRMTPVAPFTVINLVAGAFKIRFSDFAIGTLIGMLPAMLAVIVLTGRLQAAVRSPGLATMTTLVLLGAAIAIAALFVTRSLLRFFAR